MVRVQKVFKAWAPLMFAALACSADPERFVQRMHGQSRVIYNMTLTF